jgi:hypothetical protein
MSAHIVIHVRSMGVLCKRQAKYSNLYKTNYNQDMLRNIPFESIFGKLFNHKVCIAECSVGV